MISVDAESFLTIALVSALAALAVGSGKIVVPVVVAELAGGIIVGPDVLGLAQPDEFIGFFSSLGLGMLFFFAGYEIDFKRIAGTPLRLAVLAWVLSLLIAYTIGGLLAAVGIVLSLLYTGSALATTAIGTLIPILSDAGEMRTRFGTFLLAAGAAGEFGPILLVTLFFSAQSPVSSALLLIAFITIAVIAALLAVRGVGRSWGAFERTMETSAQLPIRAAVLTVFALATLAASLGLDLLLGGFVAGIIVRLALQGRELPIFESKLNAVGYGFLIPFFFVASGVSLDLASLVEDPIRTLELPLFVACFLLVRGVPAMLLYRRVLELRDRAALAFFSATELPLVVAITTIAVDQGHMRPATAAALVGAAVLSTAIYPLIGLRLRREPVAAAEG